MRQLQILADWSLTTDELGVQVNTLTEGCKCGKHPPEHAWMLLDMSVCAVLSAVKAFKIALCHLGSDLVCTAGSTSSPTSKMLLKTKQNDQNAPKSSKRSYAALCCLLSYLFLILFTACSEGRLLFLTLNFLSDGKKRKENESGRGMTPGDLRPLELPTGRFH